jgi:hypothetical protein
MMDIVTDILVVAAGCALCAVVVYFVVMMGR